MGREEARTVFVPAVGRTEGLPEPEVEAATEKVYNRRFGFDQGEVYELKDVVAGRLEALRIFEPVNQRIVANGTALRG